MWQWSVLCMRSWLSATPVTKTSDTDTSGCWPISRSQYWWNLNSKHQTRLLTAHVVSFVMSFDFWFVGGWEYQWSGHLFVGENTKFAICNACGQSILHGGKTTKTFNTTNLVYLIRGMHAELHSELLKKCDERTKEKTSAPNSRRQLTLQESSDKERKWDINDPCVQHIHTRIDEMIALDYQPLSIVDVGFVRLLHSMEPRVCDTE